MEKLKYLKLNEAKEGLNVVSLIGSLKSGDNIKNSYTAKLMRALTSKIDAN